MVNESLLRETMEYIETHPQQWRQEVWGVWTDENGEHPEAIKLTIDVEEVNSCGSAFCFAGHAAIRQGFPPPPKTEYESWRNKDGVYVETFATEKLGITHEQAEELFAAGNSMEDLRKMVDAIIENPDISGEDLYELTDRYDDDDDDAW